MEILFATALEAYKGHRDVLVVALREHVDLPGIGEYMERFSELIGHAKESGIVRRELGTSTITGVMLDCIFIQVHNAPFIKLTFGIAVLTDREYQQYWCKANLDLFLHGILT